LSGSCQFEGPCLAEIGQSGEKYAQKGIPLYLSQLICRSRLSNHARYQPVYKPEDELYLMTPWPHGFLNAKGENIVIKFYPSQYVGFTSQGN
jgi:hypothetical protein